MDELKKIESKFKKRLIEKADYIKEMYKIHKNLFDYSKFIANRNIGKIEISDREIIFTTKNGIKIVCDADDERSIATEILNFRDYESEELEAIRKFLKKDSVILDIGANIGWYSLNLSKNVPNGKIFSFEPIPKTYGYLEKNIKINGLGNVKPFNLGIGEENKDIIFNYYPEMSGAASAKNLHEGIKKVNVNCKIKKLDSFIPKLTKRVDFIKCDVEGAEIFVVRGGIEIIKKHFPVIFMEMLRKWSAKYDYHPNDIIKILKNIGYECFFLRGEKLVKINQVNEKTKATNFFFIHKDYKG
ncbi:MAG: FkbM family methyltransferase [Candidatus Staskawiczbacteria bacterium]|nr:FkbM family methyltransferase [Candidatus Staskawiczbacteria bacterium]